MDNKAILKWLLVVLSSPLWWPVLKTLWREANRMLVDDGGVFGAPPNPLELDERRREIAAEGDPLIHEPLHSEAEREAARGGFAARRDHKQRKGTRSGRRTLRKPVRRGFR